MHSICVFWYLFDNRKRLFLWVQKDCPDYLVTHIFFSVSNFVLVTILVIITNTKISGSIHTYYQMIVLHNYKNHSSKYVTTKK